GIGPCYADKMKRTTAVRFADLLHDPNITERLRSIVERRRSMLKAVFGDDGALDEDAVVSDVMTATERLSGIVCDTTTLLHDAMDAGKIVLFEGANGTLLDVDHGTYPYVTSSSTGPHGIGNGAGIPAACVARVVGTMKAYATRVGSGPFVSELTDEVGDRIRVQGNEFGTTTGRPRRCGWFDAVSGRHAARLTGTTDIAMMHLDTLGGFDKGTSWNFEARLFNEQATDLTIVPFFGWRSFEFSTRNDASPIAAPEPNSRGDKVSDVNFGVSLNWDVNSNNLLIFATELGFFNRKFSNQANPEERELDVRTIPTFFIALESDINSWMTTRIGARKNMTRTREVTYDAGSDPATFTETITTDADFDWTLGLGFHVAEWDIDLDVHEETPFRLGYWITGFGADVTSSPVGRMSATYRF
ncbi:MAG: adenylosuccinate synthetase, partial [bacterium]|nr:adenylosuccinate synthetase [bacterium]